MLRLVCFALASSVVAGCSGPPGSSVGSFDWRIDLGDLDEAMLSVWAAPDGSEAVAVGGAGGEALVLEWDGGDAWRAPIVPDGASLLWWAWGDGGVVFAVGDGATLLRREGGLWRAEPGSGLAHPQATFYGVWGSSVDDVWVVGGSFLAGVPSATILHWDGVAWSADDPGPASLLFKVWGTGRDDVWAVGADGTSLHRGADGVWRAVDTGTDERLIAIIGRAPDDVYAVGGDAGGLVIAWDGVAWRTFAREPDRLSAIWTAPGRPLYVGGDRGLLVRYAGDVAVTARPVADVDFHCLSGGGDRVLAVGADILGGTGGDWGGAIASHGGATAGAIQYAPRPDAGPVDATPPDASTIDGDVPDAQGPGPGEPCGFTDAGIPICAAGLECWLLATSGAYLCTQPCASATECDAYGPAACCRRPGFQTLTTVCIPDGYVECDL